MRNKKIENAKWIIKYPWMRLSGEKEDECGVD